MGQESSRGYDVFLSYSSKDKTWADAACAVLERERIRCWIAPRDISPGEEWGAAIIKGINGSRILALILSGHSNASGQVRREVERAISRGMPVLPIRIEKVLPEGAMEYALGNTHWLDVFEPPVERQLELIARSVKALLANDAESTSAPKGPQPAKQIDPVVVTDPLPPGSFRLVAIVASILAVIAVGFLVSMSTTRNDGTLPSVDAPLESGELVGVITSVDARAKTLSIKLAKDGKVVELSVNPNTDYFTKKGEGTKVDLEKITKGVRKNQDAGGKGLSVIVTHARGVATKVVAAPKAAN
jgi:hypothetical protein